MRLTHNHHRTHTARRPPTTRPPTHRSRRQARTTASTPSPRSTACAGRTRPSATPGPGPARRRRSLVLLGLSLAAAGVLLTGSSAHADTVTYLALATTVDQVISNIRKWIMGILAGVALVFLTVGGLRYLMASGDPGEIEKAKGAFKAAGIGFGLAALAPIVVQILTTIVGGL